MKLILALVCCAAASAGPSGSEPVDRIVKLLTELKANIASDGKNEANVYNKYACWCETTATRKANDIHEARDEMRSLGQSILKLKGDVATHSFVIDERNAKIKETQENIATATAIRQRENGEFMSESAEMKESLASLEKGINVLAGGSKPAKWNGGALIQSVESMEGRSAVANVLNSLPSRMSGLSSKNVALLSEFASATSTYAPQSATIQGMLGDMYLTFSTNVELSTEQEADRNANFEAYTAANELLIKNEETVRDRRAKEMAAAEAQLAESASNYDDTQQQLKADTAFFDQMKADCLTKHEEWTERSAMRKEESEGLTDALKILTSDKNRALFDKSIKPGVESFLQIESMPALLQGEMTVAAGKAYTVLKAQVRKAHSLRLASLAVEVREAKVGHFAKVIQSVDNMMAALNTEGADDRAKKTECLEEYQVTASKVADLDNKIENNNAKVDRIQGLIDTRTAEKKATVNEIAENTQILKDMAEQNTARHQAFEQARTDDENALKVLTSAKEAMSSFYKNNNVDMGEIQGSVKLLQKEPVFQISKDQAPDASLSHRGNHKMQSKNILSLFAYIMEDLSDELANERKADMKATESFLDAKALAEQVLKDLRMKKDSLTSMIADRGSDKKDEEQDLKWNTEQRAGDLKYKASITPDCDWIMSNFDGRAEARASEMEGLEQAKAFLAGQTAFIAKQKFLGAH